MNRRFEKMEGSWNPESIPKFTFDYAFIVCVFWKFYTKETEVTQLGLLPQLSYSIHLSICLTSANLKHMGQPQLAHNEEKRWHSDCIAFIKVIKRLQ